MSTGLDRCLRGTRLMVIIMTTGLFVACLSCYHINATVNHKVYTILDLKDKRQARGSKLKSSRLKLTSVPFLQYSCPQFPQFNNSWGWETKAFRLMNHIGLCNSSGQRQSRALLNPEFRNSWLIFNSYLDFVNSSKLSAISLQRVNGFKTLQSYPKFWIFKPRLRMRSLL